MQNLASGKNVVTCRKIIKVNDWLGLTRNSLVKMKKKVQTIKQPQNTILKVKGIIKLLYCPVNSKTIFIYKCHWCKFLYKKCIMIYHLHPFPLSWLRSCVLDLWPDDLPNCKCLSVCQKLWSNNQEYLGSKWLIDYVSRQVKTKRPTKQLTNH